MRHFCNNTVAEEYKCGTKSVRDAAFRYMLRHFPEVCDTHRFKKYIDKVTLESLISSVGVRADASERLWAVIGWIGYDEHHRQRYLSELLHEIPAALLTKCDYHRLKHHHLVQRSCRASLLVKDMMEQDGRPYYQDSGSFDTALDITSLRRHHDKLDFCFKAARDTVEFDVSVSASSCLRDLEFTLKCKNVRFDDSHSLPQDVEAHVVTKLCYGHRGCHSSMEVVKGSRIECKNLEIVSNGKPVPIRFCLARHISDCALRCLAHSDKRIVLFVQVKRVMQKDGCHC